MVTAITEGPQQGMELSRILKFVGILLVVATFGPSAEGQCNATLGPVKFERGRTFYFHIADNIRGTSLETQIRAAMQDIQSLQGHVDFQEVQTAVSTSAYGI